LTVDENSRSLSFEDPSASEEEDSPPMRKESREASEMEPVTLIWEGEGGKKKEVVDEGKKLDATRLVSFPPPEFSPDLL